MLVSSSIRRRFAIKQNTRKYRADDPQLFYENKIIGMGNFPQFDI